MCGVPIEEYNEFDVITSIEWLLKHNPKMFDVFVNLNKKLEKLVENIDSEKI